tara:strand:+ start:155 stop:421 length:267 start_codon:yes stop_codon:yes gene_type:complete
MFRVAKRDLKEIIAESGAVEKLVWKGVEFIWKASINSVDQYVAEGLFVLAPKKRVYEDLTLTADYVNNVFHIKTGRGQPLTVINLIDV